VGIIIAPETGEGFSAARWSGVRFGVYLTYIVKAGRAARSGPRRLTAEPFLFDSPFVMYLGDNLLQGGIEELVSALPQRAIPTR